MCGIVGIVKTQERETISAELVRKMNQTLTHRGPDDEGYYFDRGAALAIRRLKIIDLEGGHQPIANDTQEVWTVFNGEIYNFQSLREALIKKGHRFRSQSDTEVIVHLYEEEGEQFVHQLRGMFAIALWDKRSRKLLLYRDRIGIKPLHYWLENETLVFASEIKALLEYPDLGRDLSLSALSDYLSFLYIPTPKTIYQNIYKLPAGHFLRFQNGKASLECYWDLSFQTKPQLTEKDWVERLRHVLEESVRLHTISDVPVGAFLSGGMDSSTVVAWMSRQSQIPIKTYSIGFGDRDYDELPYAREVATRCGTDHHEDRVETDAFELLPKIISGFDEPFADSSAIPTYWVSRFARRDVTVALSGDGGDELFAGYLWTRKEMWLEKYRNFPSGIRNIIEKVLLGGDYRPMREQNFPHALRRFVFDAKLSAQASFGRRAMCFQPWMKKNLLEPWVTEALREDESSDVLQSFYAKAQAASVIEKLLYLDTKVYLPDDLLTKVDRMSMMHSLEVRVPLLDHQVVELAASMPASLKLRNGTTKYILKKSMKDLLPPSVLKQRKQGFSIPIHRWFREDLYSLASRILLEDSKSRASYFRKDYIRWLLEEHRAGRQQFGSQIYALLVFELWRRLQYASTHQAAQTSVSLGDLV